MAPSIRVKVRGKSHKSVARKARTVSPDALRDGYWGYVLKLSPESNEDHSRRILESVLPVPAPWAQLALVRHIARHYQYLTVKFKEPNTISVGVITRDNPSLSLRSYPLI